jgi:molecular chaperone GrpE (heat shock protein)
VPSAGSIDDPDKISNLQNEIDDIKTDLNYAAAEIENINNVISTLEEIKNNVEDTQ